MSKRAAPDGACTPARGGYGADGAAAAAETPQCAGCGGAGADAAGDGGPPSAKVLRGGGAVEPAAAAEPRGRGSGAAEAAPAAEPGGWAAGGRWPACPLCGGSTGRWWPLARAPLLRLDACGAPAPAAEEEEEEAPWSHVECAHNAISGARATWSRGGEEGCAEGATRYAVEVGYAKELMSVVALSPYLIGRQAALRICFEEMRLSDAAARGWPPAERPAPPRAAYDLAGVSEVRISSCPQLSSLPLGVCAMHTMKALVLISDGLTELPAEVGQLVQLTQLFLNGNFLRTVPQEVGTLPVLEEACFDSNQLESLPPFTSPKLVLFTAPANHLAEMPPLAGGLDRLEVHGNRLTMVVPPGSSARWDNIKNLKLMGNRLRALPEEVGQMHALRTLLVAGNELQALPASLANLRNLEWLFAYHNALAEFPTGVLAGAKWLDRVLLEGNPLSHASMDALLGEAAQSRVTALGLDTAQVRAHAGARPASEEWRALPACVTVGTMLPSGGAKCYMKLVRASQLRRGPGERAACEPGGPPAPDESRAGMLVVAFSASQGEPEWLGVLRRMAGQRVRALPPHRGPVVAEVGLDAADPDGAGMERVIAALWSQGGEGDAASEQQGDILSAELEDFDVLSVIDHRMRWHAEENPAFEASLASTVAQYRRSMFVGASMGGFGALLHGSALADAVVAFGPQTRLDQATLRPPAASLEALSELSERARCAVAAASARGALVEVHCAADEHCWHALNLSLGDLCLTVHPLIPRKPFARLLNRAEQLGPILADAACRVMQQPARHAGRGACADGEPRIAVARWGTGGRCTRFTASRQELLQLLFSPSAGPCMPRPGDWFCGECRRRNMSTSFFCHSCGIGGASIAHDRVVKIPGGRRYPTPGDWGCGKCGAANCSYDRWCPQSSGAGWCWGTRDHERAVCIS